MKIYPQDKRYISVLSAIVFICAMVVILDVYYSPFRIEHFTSLTLLFAAAVCLYILLNPDITLRQFIWKDLSTFVIPMILVTFISCLGALLYYHVNLKPDITQSVRRCAFYGCSFLIAYFAVRQYRHRAPIYIIVAGLINYIAVFAAYVSHGGWRILLHFQNNFVDGISLEVHNLTYCFALFFLYFLINGSYMRKMRGIVCSILAVCIFFGNKRAVYLGLFVGFTVYLLFGKLLKIRRQWLPQIFCGCLAAIPFAVVWMIYSGRYDAFASALHINDMARGRMWNFFSGDYDLSPLYVGRALSYTDNVMGRSATMQAIHFTESTMIHNDLLKSYIGWGFLPSLYYWINFFNLRAARFYKRCQEAEVWKYLAVACFTLVIYCFDNMLVAINYNICFFTVILLLEQETNER